MSLLIAFLFAFTLFPQPTLANKASKAKKSYRATKSYKTKKYTKKAKRYPKRRFYVYKKRSMKLYQEMILSPQIKQGDFEYINKALLEKGASSVKLNTQKNSLILQYRSAVLNAVDIIQLVKEVGYTVVSID